MPFSKPSARRSASVGGTGPIPVRTPVIPVGIPVGIPTVPYLPGAVNASKRADEGGPSPDSPTFAGGEDAGVLPVVSWSGQATTNPPTIPLANQLTPQPGEMGGYKAGDGEDGNILLAIHKGVKLKRTLTNDRSAPRIA